MTWFPDDARFHYNESYKDLIPKPLKDLDKTAFHMHATEIEKNMKDGFKDKERWSAVRHIVGNYCRRTGVNYNLLLDYVASKRWKKIYQDLIQMNMV